MLDLKETDEAVDLFCGIGNFTLPLAQRVRHVTGVDVRSRFGLSEKVVSLVQADPAVLKRLVGNAKVNGLAQKALVSSMLATAVIISSYCERSNITGLTPPAEPLRRARSAVRCMVRS